MSRFTSRILLLLLTLIVNPVFANDRFEFTLPNFPVNDWEFSRLKTFLNDVESLIPPVMKPFLKSEIDLTFVDWSSEHSTQNFFLHPIDCSGESTFKDKSMNWYENQKAGSLKMSSSGKSLISLNKLFWPEILKGSKASTTYNCGLKNTYRLALSTLLHELAHIFDEKTNFSSERRFLHLTTFNKKYLFFMSQKNKITNGSPDPYDLSSPAEAFAVNLSYFLLDPEFQCRRPALNNYFVEKLEFRPFKKNACKPNRFVTVDGFSKETRPLDLERFYRADYFLAARGSSAVSAFGHSMLRLVFCPPGVALGENCVSDSRNHIIVSFRANLVDKSKEKTDGIFSFLNGLYGKIEYFLKGLGLKGSYPSKMFLMTQSVILNEYNNYDFRDVISTPLKLSEVEKRDLLDRVLEIQAGYEGSYQFFTNNCKSETEDLLKSVLRGEAIEQLNDFTPVGMREGLQKAGLTYGKETTHKALYHVLFTASEGLKRKLQTEKWQPLLASDFWKFMAFTDFTKASTMQEYTKKFTSKERRDFILSLKNSYEKYPVDFYKSVLRDFLTLESGAFLFITMDHFIENYFLAAMLIERVEDFEKYLSVEEMTEIKHDLDRITAAKQIKKVSIQGYGVEPMVEQTQVFPGLEHFNILRPEIAKKIENVVALTNATQAEELKFAYENIQILSELHKKQLQANGLTAP